MIIYRPPNFKEEFETIKTIPALQNMTMTQWINFAQKGSVRLSSDITNLNFDKTAAEQYFSSLSQEKQDNYRKIRATSEIEMPIILTSETESVILSGKTRLSGLMIEGWNGIYVWEIVL